MENKITIQQHTQKLPVMESFYTLQGEGFYTGTAAYFIRLAGCNVGCVWCDVKESWDENQHPQFTVDEIIAKMNKELKLSNGQLTINNKQLAVNNKEFVINHNLKKPIVVITGGEPLQHNLQQLTTTLQQQGFLVNIETSGTAPITGNFNWICLSPKKFKAPLPTIFSLANELKIVVYNQSDFAWAQQHALQVSPSCKLYLQPEWSKRETITPLIINYIQQNPQWQLSLQTHKFLNIP